MARLKIAALVLVIVVVSHKAEVLERVPYSYPTIWEKMRRGEFPRSVKLDNSGAKIAWYEDEITEWIESRERVELKPLPSVEAAA